MLCVKNGNMEKYGGLVGENIKISTFYFGDVVFQELRRHGSMQWWLQIVGKLGEFESDLQL